jgi:hypothetical protein
MTPGPVDLRVVASKPGKAEDKLLFFIKVNYLKLGAFSMLCVLQECVDIKHYGASSVSVPLTFCMGTGFSSRQKVVLSRQHQRRLLLCHSQVMPDMVISFLYQSTPNTCIGKWHHHP